MAARRERAQHGGPSLRLDLVAPGKQVKGFAAGHRTTAWSQNLSSARQLKGRFCDTVGPL